MSNSKLWSLIQGSSSNDGAANRVNGEMSDTAGKWAGVTDTDLGVPVTFR